LKKAVKLYFISKKSKEIRNVLTLFSKSEPSAVADGLYFISKKSKEIRNVLTLFSKSEPSAVADG